ncbi:unnamed protein product [Rhizophagus irregularis]|nr:unnamed protein product [Rhizophagus irregularis]CAB5393802.1 unnamed protein product [Rhizophagus irregularis]
MCEVALGQSVGELKQKCLSWITMTAKLYRQGMPAQRWDFGNITKNSRVPVNDSPGYNAQNLPAFQIIIPISDLFGTHCLLPHLHILQQFLQLQT